MDTDQTASSELGGKLWYASKPFLIGVLAAGIVILVVFAMGTAIGSVPGNYLGLGAVVGGVLVFIGGLITLYRIFKAV